MVQEIVQRVFQGCTVMEDEECDFHFPTQCDSGRVIRLEARIHTLLAGSFQTVLETSKLPQGTFEESMPPNKKK